ncbi:MAG: hypothetical protein KFH87_12845 [Bacteroidetes bacterium]|nr:hypothetical protein [Bacteroidota bacterium]
MTPSGRKYTEEFSLWFSGEPAAGHAETFTYMNTTNIELFESERIPVTSGQLIVGHIEAYNRTIEMSGDAGVDFNRGRNEYYGTGYRCAIDTSGAVCIIDSSTDYQSRIIQEIYNRGGLWGDAVLAIFRDIDRERHGTAILTGDSIPSPDFRKLRMTIDTIAFESKQKFGEHMEYHGWFSGYTHSLFSLKRYRFEYDITMNKFGSSVIEGELRSLQVSDAGLLSLQDVVGRDIPVLANFQYSIKFKFEEVDQ